MAKINLKEIVGNSQTLIDAFNKLKGMEIMQEDHLGSSYITIEARKEFVILEENSLERNQFLHPYGTSVLYYVFNEHPKSVQSR